MLPPKQMVSPRQRQLLKVFDRLSEDDKKSLQSYAEFLASREASEETQNELPTEFPVPDLNTSPEGESVVGAIKRLSKTYHMIDKDDLLHKASALMGAHVLQGREAKEVISELEELFDTAYQEAKQSFYDPQITE